MSPNKINDIKSAKRDTTNNSGKLYRTSTPAARPSWGPSTPPELLLQVLRHLAPGAPQYNLKCVELEYIHQRSYFAQLRLVCKAWDGLVLVLLLETTLLFMRGSDEDTRRNLVALDYHPDLIKSLVVVTKHWGSVDIARSGFEKKIDGRLRSCSKLRELTLAEGDFTFLDRRWPKKTCPGLASTVTSLKLAYVSRKMCSLALVGLGHNLTSLEVSLKHTHCSSGEGPIHMSSNMPRLSRLIWTDYNNSLDSNHLLILKLVSRIIDGNDTRVPSPQKSSPLRCLLLYSRLSASAVVAILSTNNIGSGLTSFAYLDDTLEPSKALDLATCILKLCPQLTDFAFEPLFHGDMFKYLPHTLERFTFSVVGIDDYSDPDDPPDPIDAFEDFLDRQTHTLDIHVHLCPRGWVGGIPENASTWKELLERFCVYHTIDIRRGR